MVSPRPIFLVLGFANFNSGVVIDRFDSQLEQAEGSAVAVHFEVTLVGGLAGDLTQASIQIVDGKGTLIIENRNGKFVVTKLKSLKTS